MILFIVKILNLFHTFIAVNLQSPITTFTNLCGSYFSEFQLLSILLYINVNYFTHVYYNINLNINLWTECRLIKVDLKRHDTTLQE